MLATVASALRDFGAVCGALVAVGALLTLLTKAKPVRWVGRTLVGDPVTKWHRNQVSWVVEPSLAEIRDQLRVNGGKSLRDRVDAIEDKVDDIAAQITSEGQSIRDGQ